MLLLVAPATGHAQLTDPSIPIQLNASSLVYEKNSVIYKDVSIKQGDVSIEAQEAQASGLEFENSEWRFNGNVRIRLPNGYINSESATVTFANHEIERALMTGAPAEFEQRRDNPDQLARGRAGEIEYNIGRGTVTLSQSAWLSDGSNEIASDKLVYDMQGERVLGNPDGGNQGVSITFHPRSGAAERLQDKRAESPQ